MDIDNRFRGFLPVVVDVETGGLDTEKSSLLEIAAVEIILDNNVFKTGESLQINILPHKDTITEQSALDFNGIKDPFSPLRNAIEEKPAITEFMKKIRLWRKKTKCTKCVLVGHNSFFDLEILNAAISRNNIKRNNFHPFTSFDTATLSGVSLGETVLAKALAKANVKFDNSQAHSAIYDATKTADLFCYILNNSIFPIK